MTGEPNDNSVPRPKRLVSRADVARLGGCAPCSITRLCHHELAGARVGELLDLDHPELASWLAKRKASGYRPARKVYVKPGPKPKPPEPKPKARPKPASRNPKGAGRKPRTWSPAEPEATPATPGVPQLDAAGLTDEILDLKVREVAERFGTAREYVLWLEAYHKQQRGREIWLKNEQTEGALIDRELVHQHVFAYLSAIQHRLLTDAARTITARLYPMAKTGTAIEAGEREVREQIAKQLKALKAKINQALKRKSPGT